MRCFLKVEYNFEYIIECCYSKYTKKNSMKLIYKMKFWKFAVGGAAGHHHLKFLKHRLLHERMESKRSGITLNLEGKIL